MSSLTTADLDVVKLGDGPPIVFVHGTVVGAETTRRRQLPYNDRLQTFLARHTPPS